MTRVFARSEVLDTIKTFLVGNWMPIFATTILAIAREFLLPGHGPLLIEQASPECEAHWIMLLSLIVPMIRIRHCYNLLGARRVAARPVLRSHPSSIVTPIVGAKRTVRTAAPRAPDRGLRIMTRHIVQCPSTSFEAPDGPEHADAVDAT